MHTRILFIIKILTIVFLKSAFNSSHLLDLEASVHNVPQESNAHPESLYPVAWVIHAKEFQPPHVKFLTDWYLLGLQMRKILTGKICSDQTEICAMDTQQKCFFIVHLCRLTPKLV